MYPEDLIESLFDLESRQYLKHKNRGGTSGAKGNTYENFFAVYQIALHAKKYIENGETVSFTRQVQAFVDDLIVVCDGEPLLKHYQLKNSSTVSWGNGLRSIADDFEKQQQLNQAMSKESELGLVVPNPELQARLASSMPAVIEPYSQVLQFPYAPNLLQVIAQLPEFRDAIAYLSAFEQPPEDKVECVAAVLLGAWELSDRQNVPLGEVLKKAQQFQPSFIRSFSAAVPEIDVEVVRILSQILDFTYTLTKGFLHWQYKEGLDQGILHYSCETEEFQRFQDLVKRHSPSSFEELEGFLL